jgi:hypothetical protein
MAIQQISQAADSLAAEQAQRAGTADQADTASRLPGHAAPHLSRVGPVQA